MSSVLQTGSVQVQGAQDGKPTRWSGCERLFHVGGHCGLFLAAVILTIALRFAFPGYYTSDLNRVEQRWTNKRAQEIARGWRALHYQQISGPETTDKLIESLPWAELPLLESHRGQGKAEYKAILRYLVEPSFEKYLLLKTRGNEIAYTPTRASSNLVQQLTKKYGPDVVREPRRLARMLYEEVHQRDGRFIVPRLTSISLEQAAVAVNTTNSGPALMWGKASRGFTVAEDALDPGIRIVGLTCPGERELVLEFGFFGAFNETTNAAPIHITLIWSPEGRCWHSGRLVLDRLHGIKTVF